MANFAFIFALLAFSSSGFTQDYEICGARPGLLSSFLSDAEKIHQKCLEQVYEEHRARALREVQSLQEVRIKLDEEIKNTAIETTLSTVQCVPKKNQPRDPQLVKRCQDAVRARYGVIQRIDKLMGWKDQTPRPQVTAQTNQSSQKDASEYPCPTQAELDQMRPVRVFHKRLNEMWIRCSVDG